MSKSKHHLPHYTAEASAGIDLRANLDNDVLMKPMERYLIPTGFFLEIPVGYEAKIKPGSSLAIKNGIAILNSSVTIDTDYRSEVCIIKVNLSSENSVIRDGKRICQMVIAKLEREEWIMVDNLVDTDKL